MSVKPIGHCTYCGKIKELEDEHVVPTCLFRNDNQAQVIVPACRDCNVKKSAGEGELAIYLLARKETEGHPSVRALWPEAMKAIEKDLSRVARAGAAATWQPYHTKNGIYLGPEVIADVGEAIKPIRQSLRFMVRGLYAWEVERRLPENVPVDLLIIPPEQFRPTIAQFARLPNSGLRRLPEDVFWWVPYLPENPEEASAWMMCFFDAVLVMGMTGAGVPRRRQPTDHKHVLKRSTQKRLDRLVEYGLVEKPRANYLEILREAQEEKKRERRSES